MGGLVRPGCASAAGARTHKPRGPHRPSEPPRRPWRPLCRPTIFPGGTHLRGKVCTLQCVPAAPHRPRMKMEGADGKGLGSGSKGGTRTSLRINVFPHQSLEVNSHV